MGSPFFECALKSDFLEKYTKTVKISCGIPANVDNALMFLYGKQPKLSDKNIEDMIDLAEFFMIPNLKSACVSWLVKQPISEKNCLSWLHLSSQYGFELPTCTDYLESHLHEVLLQKPSVTLTFESINYIFTEKRFCYLQMEDRLRFLVRWYAAQPEKREDWAEKLLESIAFEDIPMSCLNEMKCDHVYEKLLHDVNVGLEDTQELTEVLIKKSYDTIRCYDFARDLWFKIQTATHDQPFWERGYIAGTKLDVSELYHTHRNDVCDGDRLHNVNFETDEIKTYQIVTNTSNAFLISESFHFGNNVCVDFNSRPVMTKGTHRHITLVFIGKILDEEVEMVPLFSLADSELSLVTVNKDSVIALIPTSGTYVLVYDTVGCTIDKVDIKTECQGEIFPAKNGFVFTTNKLCITIMRVSGQALSNRYEVKEYALGDKHNDLLKYFYFNTTWFRYFREVSKSESSDHFQCVDHSKVEEAASPDQVVWKELSLPNEESACTNSILYGTMHLIRLPRRLLRCHVDCPHCEAE